MEYSVVVGKPNLTITLNSISLFTTSNCYLLHYCCLLLRDQQGNSWSVECHGSLEYPRLVG